MISNAYTAYMMFKGLLINGTLTFNERNKSRDFFLSLDPKSAIQTIEIELNLIYDIFYTKATLLLNKKGFIFGRVVCFLSVVVAALLFCLTDKTKYNTTDVVITFVLLVGAIVLDLYAVLKLFVSDWFIIKVPSYQKFSIKFRKFLSVWVKGYSRRWSQSISQFNILSWCNSNLALYYNNIIIKRIIHVLMGLFYVKVVPVDDGKLVQFLVEQIYEKARRDNDASTSSATGIHPIFQTNLSLGPDEDLSLWLKDLDFNEILFTWNIATDICHRTSRYGAIKNKDCTGEELYCLLSKQLSDYLLYTYFILRQQPTVSSVVGFSDIIFEETTIFGRQLLAWVLERNKEQEGNDHPETVLKRFSNILMLDAGKEESRLKQEHKKKVVLYNACKLAEKLLSLEENQWKITSKVWVELFCFAASRSQPRFHMARLNVGGELFTMAWLLMAHLGLAGQFQQDNQASLWEKLMLKKSMV